MVEKGGTCLALFPVDSPAPHPPPGRDTICMRHVAFRVHSGNFVAAQEELKQRGITFEFQDHQAAHSIYFKDPDGHQLEITTYDIPARDSSA